MMCDNQAGGEKNLYPKKIQKWEKRKINENKWIFWETWIP